MIVRTPYQYVFFLQDCKFLVKNICHIKIIRIFGLYEYSGNRFYVAIWRDNF